MDVNRVCCANCVEQGDSPAATPLLGVELSNITGEKPPQKEFGWFIVAFRNDLKEKI